MVAKKVLKNCGRFYHVTNAKLGTNPLSHISLLMMWRIPLVLPSGPKPFGSKDPLKL